MRESRWSTWWTSLGFAAGAVLVLSAAYAVSEALDPVYPQLRERLALFERRRSEVRVVSVGNSHARAVDFAAMGLPGVHFWRTGQDAFESAYLARYAAERAPRLEYVLFTASDGFQRADHGVVGSRDDTDRRRELYARIPLRRPIPGDAGNWVRGALSPVARRDHWLAVVRPARRAPPVELREDGTVVEPTSAPLHPDSLPAHAAAQSARHRAKADQTLAAAPRTPERVADALDALAGALRARGIVLVLYTPPYHESFLRRRDSAVMAETRALLDAVVRRNPNAVWLDFSDHPAFSGPELFRDSDHLGPDGARRFSVLLRECLRRENDCRDRGRWGTPGGTAEAEGR